MKTNSLLSKIGNKLQGFIDSLIRKVLLNSFILPSMKVIIIPDIDKIFHVKGIDEDEIVFANDSSTAKEDYQRQRKQLKTYSICF